MSTERHQVVVIVSEKQKDTDGFDLDLFSWIENELRNGSVKAMVIGYEDVAYEAIEEAKKSLRKGMK